MYKTYFGLTDKPFSIAPDPSFLYMSTQHREAMAHLSYGLVQDGCFIVLTGEVGTGKTTLCRNLLNDLPDNTNIALIINANIDKHELLQTISDELKIAYSENDSQRKLLDLINQYLLDAFARGKKTILVIDEAQLLKHDVLEQIRLLTNLETTKNKLLQILLIGQPELNITLSRSDLRQVSQRITARYHLKSLTPDDIGRYINHRLYVAGCTRSLFSKQAVKRINKITDGIPRKINVLADHSLLAAYSQDQSIVTVKTIDLIAKEVFVDLATQKTPFIWPTVELSKHALWAIVGVTLASLLLYAYFTSSTTDHASNSIVPDTSVSLDNSPEPTKKQKNEIASKPEPLTEKNPLESTVQKTQVNTPPKVITPESLTYLLERMPDKTNRIIAARQLANLWDTTLPSVLLNEPCSAITQHDLVCTTVTSQQQIINFNRPAILVLQHNDQFHRVVLSKLTSDSGTIMIDNKSFLVSRSELFKLWTNKGLVYWKPNEVGNLFRKQGDNDSSVLWLRIKLNELLKQAQLPLLETTISTYFDDDLAHKTIALQQHFDLQVDGAIGIETLLLINEFTNEHTPPLLQKR